jgi:hypothetical protein
MKITYSKEQIGSFGGLNFVAKEISHIGLEKIMTETIGKRSNSAEYSYLDVVKNMWLIFFAGGDCAEDIQENLKTELEAIPGNNVCSADTIGRVQKSLSLAKEIMVSKSGVVHEFSKHDKLNELNLRLLLKTKALKKGGYYDFDYDNQFIPTEKFDSKKSYKMKNGYFPGVSTIGTRIVHFENRNGNSNVKYKQAETLRNSYSLLKAQGININRSRMDCGSFSQAIIAVVEEYSKVFYIRAQRCEDLSEQIRAIEKWEPATIASREVEVASIYYAPFGKEKKYRYVISREKNKTGQIDTDFQSDFIYRAIITNDEKSSTSEIIEYYNQRGASERIFDEMNNDFGWKKLPFSFLEENTVFMIIMAMCRNFYLYFINKIAPKFSSLKRNYRLKKFIFRFVVVPYKWVTHARETKLKLYTSKSYDSLL